MAAHDEDGRTGSGPPASRPAPDEPDDASPAAEADAPDGGTDDTDSEPVAVDMPEPPPRPEPPPQPRKARRAVFGKRKGKAKTPAAAPRVDPAPSAFADAAGPEPASPPVPAEPVSPPLPPEPASPPLPPEPMTPPVPPEPMTPELPPEPVTPEIPAEPLTPPISPEPLSPPTTAAWDQAMDDDGRDAPADPLPVGAGAASEEPEPYEYGPGVVNHDGEVLVPAAIAVPRRRRRWPWYALAAVVVIGIVIVGGALYLPRLAEQELVATLHGMGFTAAQLSVDTVGFNQAVVRDLKLGPELTAQQVVASYTVAGLRAGRIDRVLVRGLRGRIAADQTGPPLGSLGAPIQALLSAGGDSPAALPTVALEDAVVEVATPLGPATVRLAGEARPEPDALAALGFDVQAEAPLGRLAGRLEATVAEDGSAAGSFIVKDGSVAVADQGSTKVAGFVQFALSAAGLDRLDSNLSLADTSVAGTSFTQGTLRVSFDKQAAALNLLLDSADDRFDIRASGLVQDPFGAGALSASVEIAAAQGAPVWALAGVPEPAAGRLRLKGTVSGALPQGALLQPAALVDTLAGQKDLAASLQIDLEQMRWPGFGEDISASGAVDLAHDEAGGVLASVPAEILGEMTPAPELLDALGLQGKPRDAFAGHLSLSLAFAQPLLVLTAPATITVSGRPLLSLLAPGGQELSADVWGTIVAGRDGQLRSFRIDAGKLSALDLELDQVRLASATIEATAAGTLDAFDGTLRVAATAPGLTVPGLQLADLDLLLGGRVARAGGQLTVRLDDEGSHAVARVLKPRSIAQAKPLRLALRPGRNPFLAMDWGPPGEDGAAQPRLAFDLAIGPFSFDIPAASSAPITTRFARLALSGTLTPAAGLALTASTDGSRAAMPKQGLAATGISATAQIPQDGPIQVRYRIAALSQAGEADYLTPLAVSGSATVTDDRVGVDLRGSAAGEGLVLTAKARHDTVRDTGTADVDLKPIAFVEDGLQPWQLFPAVTRRDVQAAGSVAASGRVAWGKDTTAKLDLALKDLTLTTPQVTLRGVNGVVTVDGLDPITTPPGQEIAIGQVDLGMPLTDGILAFQLEPGNRLRIDRARLTLAGGEVAAEPAVLDWSGGTQQIKLDVKDVRLQAMLDLAEVEGLSASGKLQGAIPILIQDGNVLIQDAALVSQEPGILKYTPKDTPETFAGAGESMTLALSALRNFHYRSLRLEMARDAEGEMQVRMKIDGNNPDLYDGYPVSFNFGVSGKLDQILTRSLAGYRIPDRIRDRLTGFE